MKISVAHVVAVAGCAVVAGCAKDPGMRWTLNQTAPTTTTTPSTPTTDEASDPLAAHGVTRRTGETTSPLTGRATEPFDGGAWSAAGVSRITFAEEGADFDPCVSRDGRFLVFASTQHRTTPDIYLKKTDSRVVTQLTNDPAQDAMPVISPDGTKVAFASDRTGNWDIFVMPISGGRAVQITSDATDDVHPSWSPDGKQLVFSRHGQTSGRWEMWVTEVANPTVSNFIGYGVLPRWCPVTATGQNGADKILFQVGRERGRRSFSLWTVDISNGSTSNVTEIATSSGTALINPSWSPDGRWIVYSEVPVAEVNEESRPAWGTLWMISGEGEGKVRLTDGTGLALSPVWGANNRLFFVSDRSGTDNIWSLDLAPAVRSAQAAMTTSQPVASAARATTPATTASTTKPKAATPAHTQPAPEIKTAAETNSPEH
jgi:TolB protein